MDEINAEQWKYSAQAENSLAGCLLVDPEATLREVREIITADDFQSDACKAIYQAAAALIDSGNPCDAVLIQNEAARQGLELSGEYCAEAMQLYTTTANVAATAQVIREASERRNVHNIGNALLTDEMTLLDAIASLQEIASNSKSGAETPIEAADAFLDYVNDSMKGKRKPFLSTGYTSLDKQLAGGFITSGLITIAGRPGMGKTTVGLNLAENVAKTGKVVLYISLEMDRNQLWARRVGRETGVSYSDIYRGRLDENSDDYDKVCRAMDKLSRRQLIIRDIPSTIEDVEREARCTKNLSLLVVDHIGLIKQQKGTSRYDHIMGITHRLKALALSMHIPILALCQLNREAEKRQDKQPTLADLRDSGSVEEDSDVVVLLFRASRYLPDKNQPKPWEKDQIDFLIEKNRHGMCGTVTMNFFGVTSKIVEGLNYR